MRLTSLCPWHNLEQPHSCSKLCWLLIARSHIPQLTPYTGRGAERGDVKLVLPALSQSKVPPYQENALSIFWVARIAQRGYKDLPFGFWLLSIFMESGFFPGFFLQSIEKGYFTRGSGGCLLAHWIINTIWGPFCFQFVIQSYDFHRNWKWE